MATDGERYRRHAHAYLFAPDGTEVWSKNSGDVTYVSSSSGEITNESGEAHPYGFGILAQYDGTVSGHTLVTIVYGAPISVGAADAGGPVLLGVVVKKL